LGSAAPGARSGHGIGHYVPHTETDYTRPRRGDTHFDSDMDRRHRHRHFDDSPLLSDDVAVTSMPLDTDTEQREVVVVHGGVTSSGTVLSDTWVLDVETGVWTEMTPEDGPGA
ncbi:hypothetical protein KIPB_014626, partial [Kipferlia bialata]